MSIHEYTLPLCPHCGVELPAQRINLCAQVARVIRERPDLTYKEIADVYRVSARTIKRYARRAGLKRKLDKRKSTFLAYNPHDGT